MTQVFIEGGDPSNQLRAEIRFNLPLIFLHVKRKSHFSDLGDFTSTSKALASISKEDTNKHQQGPNKH